MTTRLLASITVVLLAAGCQSRTELVIGVATDLRAPSDLDFVALDVGRPGIPQRHVEWEITGVPGFDFNLPGSFGVASDGTDLTIEATLTGVKNGTVVVSRHAILGLIEGETLFYRMGLSAACIDRRGCAEGTECVEGACRPVELDPRQFPTFAETLVTSVSCSGFTHYTNTSTNLPLEPTSDAAACPPERCFEGTCLNPPVDPPATRTVRGTNVDTRLYHGVATSVPVDMSSAEVAVLVPDAAGGFTTLPGTGDADGNFAIENVPQGSYYLRWDSDYLVGSGDTWDFGGTYLARAGERGAATGTGFSFDLANLEPWADGDVLEISSLATNTYWFNFERRVSVAAGATALSGFSVPSEQASTFPIRLAGDDLSVLQLSSRQSPSGVAYTSVTRFFTAAAVTEQASGLTPVTGAFATLATRPFAVDIRGSELAATIGADGGGQATLLGPGLYGRNEFLAVRAQPEGTVYGRSTGGAPSFLFLPINAGSDIRAADLELATPIPPAVPAVNYLDLRSESFSDILLPGTTEPLTLPIVVGTEDLLDRHAGPMRPTLGPVLHATIAGRDLFQPLTSVGLSPTLRWDAPALGHAATYSLFVARLVASGTRTVIDRRSLIRTSQTTVQLPPGVLEQGRSYVIQLEASDLPDPTAPFRIAFPFSHAGVISAVFTP